MKVIIAPPQLIGTPDVAAMLQAFYSRSHTSIEDRLKEMTGEDYDVNKIRESLSKYYIQYRHDSIGDCGNILLFIEGCSMLTAKAIQDNPLYNGQETSSRYIDFTKQPRPEYAEVGYDWCMENYEQVYKDLKQVYLSEGLDEKAASVKAFDYARGFLPLGVPTQLSWYGSIRSIRQHLANLLVHPVKEVQSDAEDIANQLETVYPELFAREVLPEYNPNHVWFVDDLQGDLFEFTDTHGSLFNKIPVCWKLLRKDMKDAAKILIGGTVNFRVTMDYGSYRDIQRHRRATIKSTKPKFTILNEDNLYMREWLKTDPEAIIKYADSIGYANRKNVPITGIPLASEVDVVLSMDVPQLEYMLKLRTSPSVHATARKAMFDIADIIKDALGEGHYLLDLVNTENTDWDRRATQTIHCLTVEQRDAKIVELANRGVKQLDIARKFSISEGRVSQIIKDNQKFI